MAKSVKILQKQFQPNHYQLILKPNRSKKTFEGSVIIEGFKYGPPSHRIVLHQKDLKIKSAKVTHFSKKESVEIEVNRINYHKKYDEIRLHFNQIARPGRYEVKLEFSGKITKPMFGMYPCFFKDKGKNKELIATQFESHHARDVFPCIDEPAAKATFELTLVTPKGEEVISNTAIKDQIISENDFITHFEVTPKMSTYLLAFVYGELGYKESKTKKDVKVRVYTTPENVKYVDFALDVSVKCLDFYNEYYGIDYPLSKCDLIALPDFAAGAMENWGCITFREHALLVDPKNTSIFVKQHVATVIAHELAHQWFGNLVTMRWWTDLWLNEGFASWMEFLVIDHLFPKWQLWVAFATDEQQIGLSLDSLDNTHPVEVSVSHPDEIKNIFDGISYSKGASMLHMLYNYVGADDFRNGIRNYLQKHAYSNTDTIDLWNDIEEITHKPVKDFMHTWISRPGFPLVNCIVEDGSVSISQSRFFANPRTKAKDSTLWPIPLLSNNKDISGLFTKKEATYQSKDTTTLKLNMNQSGFYKVLYNPSHLEKIGQQIQKGHFTTLDKIGILSDIFESAKSCKYSTAQALHFISYFNNENDYAIWGMISGFFGSIRMIMADEKLREDMKPYIKNLVANQLNRLGINSKKTDTHSDMLLRPVIVSMAAAADEPTVVKYCKNEFKKCKNELNLDPELKGIVLSTVARLGNEEEFNKLVELYKKSTMSDERTTIAGAICCFKQPKLIKKALSMIDSPEVKLQDVTYWVSYSLMNRYSRAYAWKWIRDHWQWLYENLGDDTSFCRLPIAVGRVFSNEDFIKEYKKFFKPKLSPLLQRPYNQGLEVLDIHIAWRNSAFKEIEAFFSQQKV